MLPTLALGVSPYLVVQTAKVFAVSAIARGRMSRRAKVRMKMESIAVEMETGGI